MKLPSWLLGWRTQAGMTLIELLVAMTIGAITVGGAYKIYNDSRRTYELVKEVAEIQDSGRLALFRLTRLIRQAGFCTNSTRDSTGGPIKAADATNCKRANANTKAIDGLENDTDADSINIRYEAASTNGKPYVHACNGEKVANGNDVVNMIYVESNNLLCLGWQDDNSGSKPLPPITMVENVSDMQILYGIDEDENNVADCYVNASYFQPNSQEKCEDSKPPVTSGPQATPLDHAAKTKKVVTVRVMLKMAKNRAFESTVILRNQLNSLF